MPNTFYDNGLQIPAEVAHQISLRAAELARDYAPRGPKNSRSRIRATSSPGRVGIYVPPDAEHLIYLDRGIAPFIMYSLEGKTIPIRNADGSISFRKATSVGGNRIAARDRLGRIVRSERRWKHPGTEPLNFIQKALDEAIAEWVDSLQSDDIIDLLSQYPEFRDLMDMFSLTIGSRVNFGRG